MGNYQAIYRLSDFYTLFYFKYVQANNSLDEQWWSKYFNSHSVESWQGQTFELVCMMHINAIKQKLGIAGIATEVSAWRYVPKSNSEKGAQIDMVISRADRAINLCEMKFALGKRFFLFLLYIRKFPYDIYSEDLKGGPYGTHKDLHN